MPCYTEKTGGLQHRQMQSPNLPGRPRQTGEKISRQTGLDPKGVTPELQRLKFYGSRTRNFFLLFFECLFVLFAVGCSTYVPVDFFGSPFFSFFFFFLFLSWFCKFYYCKLANTKSHMDQGQKQYQVE
jgi:phosphotransferase system  glucose/maltose/N-acetylglucosamine-specific IIC component